MRDFGNIKWDTLQSTGLEDQKCLTGQFLNSASMDLLII